MWSSRVTPIVLVLAMACDPATTTDAGVPPIPATPHDCELGLWNPEPGFIPLRNANRAELTLGFQGFLVIGFLVRDAAPVPEIIDAKLAFTVPGEEPVGRVQNSVRTHKTDDGLYVTEELQVFLETADLGNVVGKTAEVAIRLDEAGGVSWACTTTGTVVLVDEDQCIHTGNARSCPDAGL